MNTRNITFFLLLLAISFRSYIAYAQTETDALRFSLLTPQSTARSMGFGSALGSIGGDFAALSVNPAGIGIYRSSEFMFTPSIKFNKVESSYLGTEASDNVSRFTFNNIGVVFTSAQQGERYNRSDWKSVSFGVGVNRLADFNRNYTYFGRSNAGNENSSLAEVFSIDANNFPEDFENTATYAGLGYMSYLVDYDSVSGYFPIINPLTMSLNRTRSVSERGGISEIPISIGGNYKEQLMLGATLGISSLRYVKDAIYTEEDATGDNNNDFRDFTFSESLNTSGVGINLKLGFIYKPSDQVRFGLAFHTPTAYSLTDVQTLRVVSNTEGYKAYLGGSDTNPTTVVNGPENTFEYNLTTPWRTVLSATGFLGTHGFITADYEYVNYASARFRYDAGAKSAETAVNRLIRSTYKGASNIRLGVEGRFDQLMLRLGFGYYGSPYRTASDAYLMTLSGGVGYRFETWFVDLGYVQSLQTNYEQPYTLDIVPPVAVPAARLDHRLGNIALTLGWKF
jgi:hypothetical protein